MSEKWVMAEESLMKQICLFFVVLWPPIIFIKISLNSEILTPTHLCMRWPVWWQKVESYHRSKLLEIKSNKLDSQRNKEHLSPSQKSKQVIRDQSERNTLLFPLYLSIHFCDYYWATSGILNPSPNEGYFYDHEDQKHRPYCWDYILLYVQTLNTTSDEG